MAGRMQIQMRDSKLPFLINDNISFSKLISLLLHLEI